MARTRDSRRFPSRRAALLSSIAAVATALLPVVEAQECPFVPEQIVSSSCELCTRGQLCQTKANKCNCFTVGAPALNFLLPFSAVTAASLNSTTLSTSDFVIGPDNTATTPWASDDDIEKFEQLVLPASTTTVYVCSMAADVAASVHDLGSRICVVPTNSVGLWTCSHIRGGNSLTAVYKGVVADVSFVGNFLGGQSQLKQVFLVSLNLANTASNLIGNFPTGVEAVALANNRLAAFPTSITKFSSLKRLYVCSIPLDDRSSRVSSWCFRFLVLNVRCLASDSFLSFNDITDVPSSSGIESLVEMCVRSSVRVFDPLACCYSG